VEGSRIATAFSLISRVWGWLWQVAPAPMAVDIAAVSTPPPATTAPVAPASVASPRSPTTSPSKPQSPKPIKARAAAAADPLEMIKLQEEVREPHEPPLCLLDRISFKQECPKHLGSHTLCSPMCENLPT
jgi:hypothetical protein